MTSHKFTLFGLKKYLTLIFRNATEASYETFVLKIVALVWRVLVNLGNRDWYQLTPTRIYYYEIPDSLHKSKIFDAYKTLIIRIILVVFVKCWHLFPCYIVTTQTFTISALHRSVIKNCPLTYTNNTWKQEEWM